MSWITNQCTKADPTVVAALITGAVTILGSVLITSYNSKLAQVRAAEESNRGKKAEIYNKFVMSFVDNLIKLRRTEERQTEEDLRFMDEFASQLIVHGGPDVIKAYGALQRQVYSQLLTGNTSRQADRENFDLLENLLLKMREELGVSNKELKQDELLRLFVNWESLMPFG
ncbi:MAG: hypothetical protein OXG88_05960 [Gammaproteobacteria bacterium]|nr:hypothetical protein [Gammaproteobacteria bacterium]